MYAENELTHLTGMGYEFSDGMMRRKNGSIMPSIQRINAERRYRHLDYDHSFLIFIERGRYRVGAPYTTHVVSEYDVRLMYPWPWKDESQPPHPGMSGMEAGTELGMLLGIPFNRETHHIILDIEVYDLIEDLKVFVGRPDLRISYDVSHLPLTLR